MTILLDTDNKTVLSISSGGFVDKTLNTVKYNGEIPETEEGEALIFENGELKAA